MPCSRWAWCCMDEFARRDDDDRLAFINETAARRDVTPIIIEKDFWVCWTLRRLMSVPVLADNLTFKGGTSLSKAYGIIERFSEDIDLTIGRNAPMIIDTCKRLHFSRSAMRFPWRLGQATVGHC